MKQQTLTIVVPDSDDDPADVVRAAYAVQGFRVAEPGQTVETYTVVIIEED